LKQSSFLNFKECVISNDLLSNFIDKIGLFKSKLAVRQALDLQRMQGSSSTLPVLILETCGTALVNSQSVKNYIGLTYIDEGMLLIYSYKLNAIQLLRDNLN
tara:strand:- start:31 stop:336 length:306 start_codon:yes stop_codon:yes gene_type:complete